MLIKIEVNGEEGMCGERVTQPEPRAQELKIGTIGHSPELKAVAASG